jgi:hypothetical protein
MEVATFNRAELSKRLGPLEENASRVPRTPPGPIFEGGQRSWCLTGARARCVSIRREEAVVKI